MTTVVNMRNPNADVRVTPIDRHTIFGNPFYIGKDGNRDRVCDKYKVYFDKRIASDPYFKARVLELKDKYLGCWCEPLRCHGETIAEYLNGK